MLTDADCKNATCPEGKPRLRLSDSGGLYLEVTPNGSRRWFAKYRMDGKEKRLALGSYPAVTLRAARLARDAARKTQATGTDPVQARKLEKVTASASRINTFEAVARSYHATKAPGWSASHARQWLRCVEKDLLPWLGTLPIDTITAPLLLEVVRKTEKRGATQLALDLCEFAGQVFKEGMRAGHCTQNPAPVVRGGLRPHTTRHAAAILDPVQAGALLRAMDEYSGQPATRAALALSALLFQRPGNIRAMEWAHIHMDQAVWSIPSANMKRRLAHKTNGRPHLAPLATQALAILEDLRPLTGHGRYVFPSMLTGERCMSDGTVRTALRRMGFDKDEMTAHGFRAMARTLMAERLPGISPDVIEAQLAHGKSGPLGMAYDRAEFMEQRRLMMQTWADYLDRLREGAQVLAFKMA